MFKCTLSQGRFCEFRAARQMTSAVASDFCWKCQAFGLTRRSCSACRGARADPGRAIPLRFERTRSHQGMLNVKSSPGRGTTFRVLFQGAEPEPER